MSWGRGFCVGLGMYDLGLEDLRLRVTNARSSFNQPGFPLKIKRCNTADGQNPA